MARLAWFKDQPLVSNTALHAEVARHDMQMLFHSFSFVGCQA